ncbi:MAG: MBL fold metallo-hydrolase [Candidatus Eisenbacteria bacterium]|nr:MBL fold metallo-hydrolase [Candidatus Eisenbacteria bacterium]
MKITFCGAAGEVTGSGYLVETASARVLVDFGMFQGPDSTHAKNLDIRPVDPGRLDAIVLTHAHLDHTGRLPLLARRGLKAPIWATPASCDFTTLVLEDSGRLQEGDARRLSRKRARVGKGPIDPLYTSDDVDRLRPLARPFQYGESMSVAAGITVRPLDAGHILGSASLEMTIEEGGKKRVIAFSGDVGPRGVPFLHDPVPVPHADLVIMETTYGDRDHRDLAATLVEFHSILSAAVAGRRKILIPAFAIGRTQMILFYIARMVREGGLPVFPIYLDSPMAIHATELYSRYQDLFDEESIDLTKKHQSIRDMAGLQFTESADQSRALNEQNGPMMIIAGSGMATGGRIVHHLRHNLWRDDTDVLIVGYQAKGTLGSRLVSGDPEVSIHGERIVVKAKVHTLGGFSAHAGRGELADWLAVPAKDKPRIVLTHGEPKARDAFAELVQQKFGIQAERPMRFETIEFD